MSREQIERRFEALDALHRGYAEEFGDLTLEQLWTPPAEGKWSIGQSLQHLIQLLRISKYVLAYLRPLFWAASLVKLRRSYPTEFEDIYATMKKPYPAPVVFDSAKMGASIPGQDATIPELVDLLRSEARQLRAQTAWMSDADAGNCYTFHPVAGIINFHQTLGFLEVHERHHLAIMQRDKGTVTGEGTTA